MGSVFARWFVNLVVRNKSSWSNFGVKARRINDRKMICIKLILTILRSLILRSFHARNYLKNFCCGLLGLLFISSISFASDEWSGAYYSKLHGKLIKKHFQAPRVVENPPFGWFVELDEASQQKVVELYSNLSEQEQALLDNIHLQYVRLSTNQFGIRDWVHDHCNEEVTLNGELREPDLFGEFRSFYFVPETVIPTITEKEKATACVSLDEVTSEPESLDWTEVDLSDESLVLPDDEPERCVAITGKLMLRIFNSNPDNDTVEDGGQALYCWILKLNPESFEIACSTPVRASFQTPATIRSFKNCDEMELTGEYDPEWLCDHVNQTVTIQGYLWHAHNGHHHTPVMIDTDPWFK